MAKEISVNEKRPYQEIFYKVLQEVKQLVPPRYKMHQQGYDWYNFVVQCTNYYNASIKDEQFKVLCYMLAVYENDGSNFIDDDTAFVVFYCICLYLYRHKKNKELHAFLENYVQSDYAPKKFTFEEYPIIWDLASRLCVINKDYDKLLKCSLAGKKSMPTNVSCGIAYVDGVCSWLSATYNGFTIECGPMPGAIEKTLNHLIVDNSTLDEESILLAIKYDVDAINANSIYAKYYYYLAQLYFYYRFAIKENKVLSVLEESYLQKTFADAINGEHVEKISRDDVVGEKTAKIREVINDLIDNAKKYAKSVDEKNKYEGFLKLTEFYFSDKSDVLFAKKSKIIRSSYPDECFQGALSSSKGQPYIVVSYSRTDYKSVFCDIIELQERGVNVVFDDMLVKMGSGMGATWIARYEQLLKDAKLVLCYLSEEYLKSPSVMKELKLIKEYDKKYIPIDLTGKCQAIKIINSIIASDKNDFTFKSEDLNLITHLFSDDCLTIPKPPIDDYPTHIDDILIKLKAEGADLVSKISVDSAISTNFYANGKPYHSREDQLVFDQKNKIFVVADGITRNGYFSDVSISKTLTDYFCNAFVNNVSKKIHISVNEMGLLLENAFAQSITDLKTYITTDEEYCELLKKDKQRCTENNLYFENPGCVFVSGVVYNQKLYYGYVGDCGVILIRNNQRYILATPQTYYAFKVDKVEKQRERLEKEYVNNPANPKGYGVVNGDARVVEFFNVTNVELQSGDTLYFVSDGVYPFIASCPPIMFNNLSASEILKLHEQEMVKQSFEKMDDRAIIKVKI